MKEHEPRAPVPAPAARSGPEDRGGAPAVAPPASALPLAGVATREDGLVVGRADDPAEVHADRLADAALARLHGSGRSGTRVEPDMHRHTPGCGHLRRSATPTTSPGAAVGPSGGALGATLSSRIEAVRGGGSRLAGGDLTRMESAFGRPLGHVRVHRGGEAARLNDAMSAEAFTVGDDVFLGPRAEGPGADGVLAHEIAHVLSETGDVHRWIIRRSPAASSPPQPSEEERAKQAKADAAAARAAEKRRAKDERKARKTAAKGSKKTEKAEQRALKQARERGEKDRAYLEGEVYDTSGGVDASGTRTDALNAQFEEALDYEAGLFTFLMLNTSRRGGGGEGLGEEEAAERAYHETWFVRFTALESLRPPRETAAERLVIQVRRARTGGAIQQQQLDDDTASDQAVIKLRMLGKDVELAYDRMAVLAEELVAKDPKLHPALAQSQAADEVRAGLTDKLADQMPPNDGPLDMAAWAQATERAAAKQRQAQRDRDTIETSLALLPADQQQEQRQALDATPVAYEKPKEDPLAKGEGIVAGIKTYGGAALTGIKSIGGGIAGLVGKKKDKQLREDKGVTKTSYGPVLPTMVDQGVSQAVRDSRQAADWHAKGQVKGPAVLPTSTATQVKTGFGQVTAILTSLIGAVQSAFSMVRSTKAAWQNDDVYEGLKATKAGAAGLDGLVGAARQTANLAKLIDSGVAGGVAQVVPGLDIVSAVLSIVRSTMDVATLGLRQRETDVSMFEARARTTSKVFVTVYPLMQVSQVYTKQLENACWTLGSGIGDLVLSIAQVATGGGYGIPLAVKSGKAVLDNLHSLGHFIANNVLAVMAKRAQKESEVMHLEGAAEQELSRHPKMAVDGLVVRAAQGDPVALAFLAHYRIDGKPITADYVKQIKPSSVRPGSDPEGEDGGQSMLLAKIRTAVLGSMNTSADPKTAYDEIMGYVDKVAGVKKQGAEVLSTWKDTRALAEQRNQLAKQGKLGATTKTDRGLGWRLRMFISSEKRGKLTQRTKAYEDYVPLPRGVICIIADQHLGRHTSDSDLDAWANTLTLADLEAELARRPRRNPPEAIELIRDLIRLKTSSTGGATGPSGSMAMVSSSSGAGT